MPKAIKERFSGFVFPIILLFAFLVQGPDFPLTADAQNLPKITVSVPSLTTEGTGLLAGAGQVYVRNAPAQDLIISLTSSNPSLLWFSPQPFVAVNAGENFGIFNLYVSDNAAYGGTESVVIVAAAEGYDSGSDTVVVLDNDAPTVNTRGDGDHSKSIDLRDVILSLQVASGWPPRWIYADADVDGDARIGLAEALYGLQVLAGLRIWDGAPPDVTGTIPANGAVDVLVEGAIEVTFNEDLDATTLNSGTFILSQGTHAVDGTISYAPQGHVATFTPASPLSFNTVYQISLPAGIKDLAGNTRTIGYTSSFRTVALPDMVSTVPAVNDANAAINGPIEIVFNNAIDPASVTSETLKVTGSGGTLVTGVVEIHGKTIIFTPANPLDYHANYEVALTTGIRDVYGHSLALQRSFSFVTTSVKRSYVFEFPATDAVVDASGKMAYVTSKANKKLYGVNLETGAVEKEISFDYMPESIAVNPEKTRMYVALLTREHSYYWWTEEQEGYIAEFDLATGTKLKQFRIAIDPYDLVATSGGHIYVTSGSGQWTLVEGYNVTTTARTGQASIRQKSRIKLHPSEQYAYTADTDSSPSDIEKFQISAGQIVSLWDSPYHGDHRMNGDLFIDLTGNRVVTRGGDLFTLSAEQSGDMQYIKSLPTGVIEAAAFDPYDGYLFTVESQAIRAYDLNGFDLAEGINIATFDKNFMFLNANFDEIYYIGANAGATYISVLHPPVGRTNDKPVASFSIQPESGTTLDSFKLDASSSSDSIPGGELYYVWDWDGDGIFDTYPTSNPITYHSFIAPGDFDVTLKVLDQSGYSSEVRKTVTIAGEPLGQVILRKISDMVASEDPGLVYAVDRGSQALYYISTLSQRIVKKVNLPFSQPLAMSYDAATKSLYMVGQYSGSVMVYHVDSQSFTELPFSSVKKGLDVKVAPALRRIYVLSAATTATDRTLTILNMDTGEILTEGAVSGDSLAIDQARQKVFTAQKASSPSSIYRYAVDGDQIVLEQSVDAGSNGGSIAISPDGRHIVLPCGGGNGNNYGYKIFDYDATNLINVLGEWDVGTYPKNARFSPDGARLFGTNGSYYDNNLYVMSTANYRELSRFSFPNAEDYNVFVPNADGTVVVAFSYNAYDDTDPRLYFFNVPLSGEPVNPLAPNKISDMVASDDPQLVYAVDQGNQALYHIDTLSKQIVKRVELPFTQPLAMTYDAATKTLYLVSRFSGSVTVYHLESETFAEWPFSSVNDGLDVEVAPALRRVYVLSAGATSRTLTILDMDTGEVLAEGAVNGTSLAMDPSRQKIFTADSGTIYRYAASGDQIALEQSRAAGDNCRKIAISPDGRHVVLPCGGGNGSGYTIFDYDATNLNNVVGAWDVGTYPKNARFSADGARLFGTNGDPYDQTLYVMSVLTYQELSGFSFPNADDYNVFVPNADGTVVVAFSYNTYDDNNPRLYFFNVPAN